MAVDNPLSFYKDVVKEFGVKDEYTVSPVGKIAYLQEQVAQQQSIINRLLFDIATSQTHQSLVKDDISKDAHRKRTDDFRNDLRQLLGSIKINIRLIEQLREEYPELAVQE